MKPQKVVFSVFIVFSIWGGFLRDGGPDDIRRNGKKKNNGEREGETGREMGVTRCHCHEPISVLLMIDLPRVISSVYSSSPPTAMPLAMALTLTPKGARRREM